MRITVVLLAAAALAAGCASPGPEVVDSSDRSVTIAGPALGARSDEAVWNLARAECRKHGRRHAALATSETMRVRPQWRFHCVN